MQTILIVCLIVAFAGSRVSSARAGDSRHAAPGRALTHSIHNWLRASATSGDCLLSPLSQHSWAPAW